MKKTLIIVYGVFGRSFRYTYKNHEEFIYNTLDDNGILYDICFVNNMISPEYIDGCKVNDGDFKLKHCDNYIGMKQSDIDNQILTHYKDYTNNRVKIFKGRHYDVATTKNALRNSYIESTVGKYILDNLDVYESVISFCSDLYFDKSIKVSWLKSDKVICSNQNNAGGFTNGFYVGNASNVGNVMNSFDNIKTFVGLHDFESIVKANSSKYKVGMCSIDFKFLKIRATKQPGNTWSKLHSLIRRYNAEK